MEEENDYMKRGFLLPEGCKDLIDAWKPKTQHPPRQVLRRAEPLPPIIGELTVPEQMTVRELAALLKQQPFRVVGDLMKIGVFANVKQVITFDVIAKLVRRYGYTAKKAT